MKTLFYCQHSIGIGHLMRTLRLAGASLQNGPVRLICGGELPKKLKINDRIEVIPLPPLSMAADGNLIAPLSRRSLDQLFEQRHSQAVSAVEDFQPDALIIEMFPFGRKKFATEILGIIDAARQKSTTKIFSSVRDVLVTERRDQQRYDNRAVDWLNGCFDALLIHSDAKLVTLKQTFSAYDRIAIPVYYTGYVCCDCPKANVEKQPQVVVSAGGGRVGKRLIDAASAAYPEIERKLGLDMLIVTGPMGMALSNDRHPTPRTISFTNDLPDILLHSSLSISQCGYNTATDILRAQIPAVFVPFEAEGENEQLHRARLLSRKGVAITLRENALTPRTLFTAAQQALLSQDNREPSVDLGGTQRSRIFIKAFSGHA